MSSAGLFGTASEIVECGMRVGLSGVVLAGVARVETPYLLLHEHDWEVVRPVDLDGVLHTFADSRGVKYIRLNVRHNTQVGWDFVLKADTRRRPISLLRTSAWSSNPHFARTSYYRRLVVPHIREHPEGGPGCFEGPIFKAVVADIRTNGFERSHRKWGTFLYGQFGDPAVVSHLDGRGSTA